jgi:hypothetical protein
MREKPAGGRSAEQVLDLLKDPEFCAEALRANEAAATLRERNPPQDEWQRQIQALLAPFIARWGVVPPTTNELLDADPRRRLVDAIASGRWGIVPVFPWTTDQMFRTLTKKIRRVVRKQHKDALIARVPQLVGWLTVCGFKGPAIARAVLGRRTGLGLPTKAQVIARTSWERDQELHREYRRRGVPEQQLDRRVYKRLRGSEAPASAAVRMTDKRYVERILRLSKDLETPIRSEPLSYALTMLFRALADEDDGAIKQCALAVYAAFAGESADPQAPTARGRLHEALAAGRWGLVAVFPWTTDPEVRAAVCAIKAEICAQRADGDRLGQVVVIPGETFPSDALTLLFRALARGDDAEVRRLSKAAKAGFLTAAAS